MLLCPSVCLSSETYWLLRLIVAKLCVLKKWRNKLEMAYGNRMDGHVTDDVTWPGPFMVTWRHRSCDHSIPHKPFPISGPSLYLQPFFEIAYWESRPRLLGTWGHDLDLFSGHIDPLIFGQYALTSLIVTSVFLCGIFPASFTNRSRPPTIIIGAQNVQNMHVKCSS